MNNLIENPQLQLSLHKVVELVYFSGHPARTEGEKIRKKILALIKAHPAKNQLFPPSFQRKVYQLNQLRLQALKYRLKELLGIRY